MQMRLGQAASEQQRLLREQSVADASAKDLQKQMRGWEGERRRGVAGACGIITTSHHFGMV